MHSCTFIFSKIITCFTLMALNFIYPSVLLQPQQCKSLKHTSPSSKNQVISSSKFYSKSCVVVILHQGTTLWFRVSDARLLLWAKMDFCYTLVQWVAVFIACGEFFWRCVNWQSCKRNLFNVSALQHVIRGNFPATKRVRRGGHIVLCAHWTII